jgi:hypothetical protein
MIKTRYTNSSFFYEWINSLINGEKLGTDPYYKAWFKKPKEKLK